MKQEDVIHGIFLKFLDLAVLFLEAWFGSNSFLCHSLFFSINITFTIPFPPNTDKMC